MRWNLNFLLCLLLFACEKKQSTVATVSLVRGSALIEHNAPDGTKKTDNVSRTTKVVVGDTLVTGEDGQIVLSIEGTLLEIQHHSRFVFQEDGSHRTVYLQQGSLWTKVSALQPGQEFLVRTPVTVAAVRGTKFYTTTDDKTTGTCHCEGTISLTNLKTNQSTQNDSDYIQLFRGTKALKIEQKELAKLKLPHNHSHSELDQSPLGRKNTMTTKQTQTLAAYIETRFSEIK